MINSIAVVGVGAIGITVANGLTNKYGKKKVRVLANKDRIQKYKKNGLYLNNELQDFNYLSFDENLSLESVDLLIIVTKNFNLDEVIDSLKGQVSSNTTILSLLNGIESEELLLHSFPTAKVLYSFAQGFDSEHVNNKIQCNKFGTLFIGEKDKSRSLILKEVEDVLSGCSFKVEAPEDLMHAMYKKFYLNVAYNSLSALLFAGYGYFEYPALVELAYHIFDEVQAISKAYAQVQITDEDKEAVRQTLTTLTFEGKTSMYQDFEANRQSENSWFCGTVVRLGKKFGIQTPYCNCIYLALESKAYIAKIRNNL